MPVPAHGWIRAEAMGAARTLPMPRPAVNTAQTTDASAGSLPTPRALETKLGQRADQAGARKPYTQAKTKRTAGERARPQRRKTERAEPMEARKMEARRSK